MPVDLRRRQISACGLTLPFVAACKRQPEAVKLDVVPFSYLDRPIFDVRLNRIDIGVAGAWPDSGRGTMTGVPVPLGGQKISWRLDGPKGTPRNGETVTAKNLPVLKEIPREGGWFTPAAQDIRRFYKLGEVMPNLRTRHDPTLWQCLSD